MLLKMKLSEHASGSSQDSVNKPKTPSVRKESLKKVENKESKADAQTPKKSKKAPIG